MRYIIRKPDLRNDARYIPATGEKHMKKQMDRRNSALTVNAFTGSPASLVFFAFSSRISTCSASNLQVEPDSEIIVKKNIKQNKP